MRRSSVSLRKPRESELGVHIAGQEKFEDRPAARMSRETKWLGLHHEVP